MYEHDRGEVHIGEVASVKIVQSIPSQVLDPFRSSTEVRPRIRCTVVSIHGGVVVATENAGYSNCKFSAHNIQLQPTFTCDRVLFNLAAMSSTANEDLPKPVRPSQSLTEHIHAMPGSKDCLSCRIVGTGTFAGVGAYALYQARPAALGSPMQKRLVAGLGVCTLNSISSAVSWISIMPRPIDWWCYQVEAM